MPAPEPESKYRPSPMAVQILCERLQTMGVSISEQSARRLLESVLAIEGPRLDEQSRSTLRASVETIRRAAEEAMNALHGRVAEVPRRDYELSPPPAPPAEPVTGSGKRRRVAPPGPYSRPAPQRGNPEPDLPGEDEPRPVFKRRRGR